MNNLCHRVLVTFVEFKKVERPSAASCELISPVKGMVVRNLIECSLECRRRTTSYCEGFIFFSNTGVCKLVGSSGTLSSDCHGEYYVFYS